jgi:hypothetical protein
VASVVVAFCCQAFFEFFKDFCLIFILCFFLFSNFLRIFVWFLFCEFLFDFYFVVFCWVWEVSEFISKSANFFSGSVCWVWAAWDLSWVFFVVFILK